MIWLKQWKKKIKRRLKKHKMNSLNIRKKPKIRIWKKQMWWKSFWKQSKLNIIQNWNKWTPNSRAILLIKLRITSSIMLTIRIESRKLIDTWELLLLRKPKLILWSSKSFNTARNLMPEILLWRKKKKISLVTTTNLNLKCKNLEKRNQED